VEECVSKIHQVKENVSKNDQRQCLRIAVESKAKQVFSKQRFHLIDF